MGSKKIYLEDSLEHLKKYIHDELGNQFNSIEVQTGDENREFLLSAFNLLMERIIHAIDHIKTDHLDDQ